MSTGNALRVRAFCGAVVCLGLTAAFPALAQQDDMRGMQMPQQAAREAAAPIPASTQGKQMSVSRAPSTEMQVLHFGNMIGERPQSKGIAQGTQGTMSSMHGMDMSSMRDSEAPPDARSPDYSDGYRYTDMPGMTMMDHFSTDMVLLDQLEYSHDNHGNDAAFLDGEFWYGQDFDKLWLKAEGESAHGKLADLRAEALWNHAIAAYWSTQLGLRHDSGEGPTRTWAAFGIEGLAPYRFETEATLYAGQNGRTAARVQFEYDQLLTQQLILQPKFEVNAYGKDDPQRGIGSGLSDVEFGLRLRYEIRRGFAPYVGAVWRQRCGRTADFARAQGGHTGELQFVAGLRVWF